jgi:hypothetical protein
MNKGLETGYILGNSQGAKSGLGSGFQSGFVMTNKLNMLNPATIIEPKLKPVFYINADNVALTSGSISIAYNLINDTPGQYWPKIENIFNQTAGTTYRPPLVVNGLNGKNYMNFGDTGNRYLASAVTPASVYMYASTTPAVSAAGFTYMFVVKRNQGGTYTILDGRDSSTLATTNDLLLEVTAAGRITFAYCGGNSGTVTTLNGTAGVNLLNDWSILTVKCQLRIDNGVIPDDTSTVGGSPKTTRFASPIGNRNGNVSSAIDIFVNGVEQQKTITSGSFTNADWNSDGSFRMLDRDIWIGNKGSVFATSGTQIASAMMIPAYISKAYQQRLENYFRWYYSLPF